MQARANSSEAIAAFQRGDLDRARSLAEQQLAAEPNSPPLQHLLGLIECRAGRLAAGIDWLRKAAEAEPANLQYRIMLVRALVDAGRAEEAVATARPPAGTSPAELALWHARAEAAGAAAQHGVAAEAWLAIAEARPDDWRAWTNLGNALAAQDEWPSAADALSQAVALNPADAALRRNAVAGLIQAGRRLLAKLAFADAEAAFRRAFALDPQDPDAIAQLGLVLERTNQLDALAALLETAAGDDRLNFLRAMLARRQGRLEQARDLLLKSNSASDPVQWNALRSKIADALGDPAEAFAAASAMNQAARDIATRSLDFDEWRRNADAYRNDLHRLAHTITPTWGARVPTLDDPPQRRVAFLLGFPRSGTTLLDTFLMGHPEIAVLEEQQLVGAASQGLGPIADLPSVSRAALEQARAAYFDLLAAHVGGDFAGLAIDKFPLDMASAPVIHAMFPGAPIIFAQRHPCDVVLSGFMQPFGMVNFSDIRDAADYYDAVMGIWTASRESLRLNVHDVVYEQLVRDPEPVLRGVIGFLGLDWHERLLDHQTTAKSRGTIQTPSYDQVVQPLNPAPIGRWKRYRAQLEPVLPVLLPWAERLGYRD